MEPTATGVASTVGASVFCFLPTCPLGSNHTELWSQHTAGWEGLGIKPAHRPSLSLRILSLSNVVCHSWYFPHKETDSSQMTCPGPRQKGAGQTGPLG